jgi:hypothetical protein
MLEHMTLLKKMMIDRPNNDKVKYKFDLFHDIKNLMGLVAILLLL